MDMTASKLHQAIMTPINFITFIISLYIVSGRNQQKRMAMHPRGPDSGAVASWLPAWFHDALFQPQPYHPTGDQSAAVNPPNYSDKRFYYHTKQKKIMKLEATDAFELRSSVLGALCVAAVALVWVSVCLARVLLAWGLGSWRQFGSAV